MKYRVTAAHPWLKEGLILTRTLDSTEQNPWLENKELHVNFYERRVTENPTWYEEVKLERWVPEYRELYYSAGPQGGVERSECLLEVDEFYRVNNNGNYFPLTEEGYEQAKELARRWKEVALAYQEEITK